MRLHVKIDGKWQDRLRLMLQFLHLRVAHKSCVCSLWCVIRDLVVNRMYKINLTSFDTPCSLNGLNIYFSRLIHLHSKIKFIKMNDMNA